LSAENPTRLSEGRNFLQEKNNLEGGERVNVKETHSPKGVGGVGDTAGKRKEKRGKGKAGERREKRGRRDRGGGGAGETWETARWSGAGNGTVMEGEKSPPQSIGVEGPNRPNQPISPPMWE